MFDIFIKTSGNKEHYVADCRSFPTMREDPLMTIANPVMVLIKYKIWKGNSNYTLRLKPPFNSFEVPIFIFFYAFGIQTEQEIIDIILKDENEKDRDNMKEYLMPSVIECRNLASNREKALLYLYQRFSETDSQPVQEDERAVVKYEEDGSFSIRNDGVWNNVQDNDDIMRNTIEKKLKDPVHIKKCQDHIANVLNIHILPHMGMTKASHIAKAYLLGGKLLQNIACCNGKS